MKFIFYHTIIALISLALLPNDPTPYQILLVPLLQFIVVLLMGAVARTSFVLGGLAAAKSFEEALNEKNLPLLKLKVEKD